MTIYNSYIYLWYDTKAKLFYLGGHKGQVEDSYVCSSKAMLRAYKLRPETFKFKVLQYINGSNKELREAEQRWLDYIKPTELMTSENVKNQTCRYYNVKKHAAGGNGSANKGKRRSSSWNTGVTKEMVNLRRLGLFMLLIDKPKIKSKKISYKKCVKNTLPKEKYDKTRVYFNTCKECHSLFACKVSKRTMCSETCVKISISKRKTGKPAWNKGIPNPKSAGNARAGAAKLSRTSTGRKMIIDHTGKRTWSYSSKC